MRTAKTLSISLPPEQFKAAERLARRENRTISELFREAFRRYEQQAISMLDNPARLKKLDELKAAVDLLRQEARRKGLNKITMRQIDAEVTASRKDRRRRQPSNRPVR
jgi:hypothetical protein